MCKGLFLVDLFCGDKIDNRNRQRLLRNIQTQQDAKAIESRDATYNNDELVHVKSRSGSPQSDLIVTKNDDEEHNLYESFKLVAKYLEHKKDDFINRDEKISRTFFNKWRQQAILIDEQDLREYWAQILAEEICTPKSISFKTLDIVSMFTKLDSELFYATCKYAICIENRIPYLILPNNFNFPNDSRVYWENYRHLSYLGVIHEQQSPNILANYKMIKHDESVFFFYGYKYVIYIAIPGIEEAISIPVIPLTTAGAELYRMFFTPTIDDVDQLINVIKVVLEGKKTNYTSIKVHDLIIHPDNTTATGELIKEY